MVVGGHGQFWLDGTVMVEDYCYSGSEWSRMLHTQTKLVNDGA